MTIASEFAIDALRPSTGHPDVWLYYGDVPQRLANPVERNSYYEESSSQILFKYEGETHARMLVRNDNHVVVQHDSTLAHSWIQGFLLSSGFASLLHKQEVLPLHGSAVQTPRGSVIFVGNSGDGKSTLAAALQQQGYVALADDLAVIRFDGENRPILYPGVQWFKLWQRSLDMLQHDAAQMDEIDWEPSKFFCPMQTHLQNVPTYATDSCHPLHAIYVLDPQPNATVSIVPLTGMEKLKLIRRHVYKTHPSQIDRNADKIFRLAHQIAQQTQISWLRRPLTGNSLPKMLTLLEQAWGQSSI